MPVHALLLTATLTVFAAADLTPALRRMVPDFEKAAHATVVLVPGSTGMLTQQIRNGAPADVFLAANETAIDELTQDHLVQDRTHMVYARGRLVLITQASGSGALKSLNDLTKPAIRRV